MPSPVIAGSDNVSISVVETAQHCVFRYRPAGTNRKARKPFISRSAPIGKLARRFSPSPNTPKGQPSSSRSSVIFSFRLKSGTGRSPVSSADGSAAAGAIATQTDAFEVTRANGEFLLRIPRALLGPPQKSTSSFTPKTQPPTTAGVGFGDAPIAASRVAWAINTFRIITSSASRREGEGRWPRRMAATARARREFESTNCSSGSSAIRTRPANRMAPWPRMGWADSLTSTTRRSVP